MNPKITIIGYNTHLFQDTIAGDLSEQYLDNERRDAIIDFIKASNADIVCLCEVWQDTYKLGIVERLGFKAYKLPFLGPKRPMGDGLLILSKYPLFDEVAVNLELTGTLEQFAGKRVMGVCVNYAPGQHFRIYFTHTQAERKEAATRTKNFQQMRALIDSHHPGTPAIILGDLNVESNEIGGMLEIFRDFDDTWSKAHPGDVGFTCDRDNNVLAAKFCKDDAPARYDFILASQGDWQVTDVQVIKDWKTSQGVDCSDHWPVKATLELVKHVEIPMPLFNTSQDARNRVNVLKEQHGNGCSTKIVIENDTDETLTWVLSHSNKGDFKQSPPPIIPPGKRAAVFHYHPDLCAIGSEGSFVYRVGTNGPDIWCGFRTTHSWLSGKNKSCGEVAAKSHFGDGPKLNFAEGLYNNRLDDAGYDFLHEQNGYGIASTNSSGDTSDAIFRFFKK